jgi:D-sedoheptulose 7-phosphate isomerase
MSIRSHFEEASAVLDQFLNNEKNFENIEHAGNIMVEALRKGGKVMSCGNGGSMCDAMHFAEELTGRFRHNRKALGAMSLSDVSHMSCVSNDYGYEYVFSRMVDALGQSNDVLLAISTSGNSVNIIKAIESAREKGMKVISLTGKDGGSIPAMVDVDIRAPKSAYSDRAQEIHIKVIHSLIDFIEQHIDA